MISFSRSMLVGVESLDADTLRFHGILEDHIYAMEVRMEVRTSDGVIQRIEGQMKRYTTPVCPDAVSVLQGAVGISLRESGWTSRVNQTVGRKGCQHFAEIIIECGRCLDAARLARAAAQGLRADPGADVAGLAAAWVRGHAEVRGTCLARQTVG
jgi:hypothetical protein